jgi:hypothetical protein
MKMKKSYIKNIIKEEIESYMDELISKTGLELIEAPQVSGINTNDNEELMRILGRLIAKVPEDSKENLLTTLINAVSNYIKRVAPGLPIQEAYLQTVIDEAFEGVVLNEVSKEQIKRAIAKVLMAAGVAATLAGPGAAKAADSAVQHISQQQQSLGYKGYQSGGTEKFKFGGDSTTGGTEKFKFGGDSTTANNRNREKQGAVSFKETENTYLVTVKDDMVGKEDLVINKLKREKVPVGDSLEVKKFMMKKGGKLDKSGKFRTWSFPKAVTNEIKENHPGRDQYVPADPLYKKYKNIEATSGADAALASLQKDMTRSGFQDLLDDWENTPSYSWSEMLDTIIYYSDSKMGTEKLDGLIKVGLS